MYNCSHCAERNRVVDSRHGGLYGFSASVITKGSLLVGERAPNDNYCDEEDTIPTDEKKATYGFLPNQVTQNLYRELNGMLLFEITITN